MKPSYLISCSLLCFCLLFSCNVERLVTANNKLTSDLKLQNDTLIRSVTRLNDNVEAIQKSEETPDLAKLSKISMTSFYLGDIIKEELIEKRGKWRKIKLTEKIQTQNQGTVYKQRTGWYFFNTPETIYQDNAEALSDFTHTQNMETNQRIAYTIDRPLSTGKPDLLDQKAIDLLLADRALNFDGLRFDGKRFDYANFALGSFRGTVFNNCNLSNISAKREMLTSESDFDKTTFETGTTKDMQFSFWKLKDVIFYNSVIENSSFTNCLFTSEASGLVTFNMATLKNVKFLNPSDGYFKNIATNNSSFEGCRFEDAKFYGTVNMNNTRYTSCNFYNNTWHGVSFNTSSKITGGYFSKLKIFGGDYTRIKIEAYGGMKPQFSESEIVNAILSGASIDAWFKDTTKINGLNDCSGINFGRSIFENTTFGSTAQGIPFPLRNSNFTNVEFRSLVKFIKCDLRGSTWPADLSNVEFIDCIRDL